MRGFRLGRILTQPSSTRTTRKRRSNRIYATEQLENRALLTLIVPELSSLPGADHTIHLDFDGHTTTGTGWNNYYSQTNLVAPAYNTDGDADNFSSGELAAIENAWARVAEDFRPFNINITTVEPDTARLVKSDSGDTQWGIRLIMTNEAAMVTDPAQRRGAGGLAYINSFNLDNDTPAWVFTTGGKPVAEAASHEAGHSLGLSHDGTPDVEYYRGHGSGETGWASIMGVGYYKNVSQWDNGEYSSTNNTGSDANYEEGQSDLHVITAGNGFGFRADDHGDVVSDATLVTYDGADVTASGVIETSTDHDVFAFSTGAGRVAFDIQPFTPGPNLDVKADLLNSDGNVIARSNPTGELSASFDLELERGSYYIHIDGVGVGDPFANPATGYTDYASIGQYSITGTVVTEIDPFVVVDDVTVSEGTGIAEVRIRAAGTIVGNVIVNYATADGTAVGGSDYTAVSGAVGFSEPGVKTIQIPISDDVVHEDTEAFTFNLTSVVGAEIDDGQANVTIEDDDDEVFESGLSISDASIVEGNARNTRNGLRPRYRRMRFKVTLSEPVSRRVSVRYETSDGSATTADNDYRSRRGTVRFRPGQQTKYVSVWVTGDLNFENDESFNVTLSNARNAPIVDGSAVGTIVNDDISLGGPGFAPIVDHRWYFEHDTTSPFATSGFEATTSTGFESLQRDEVENLVVQLAEVAPAATVVVTEAVTTTKLRRPVARPIGLTFSAIMGAVDADEDADTEKSDSDAEATDEIFAAADEIMAQTETAKEE